METFSNLRDESVLFSQIATQSAFNTFNLTNEKFNLLHKNLLFGIVNATYITKLEFEIKSIRTIGVLIDSYIILIPKHYFTAEIISNPTLTIRFSPFESKFKKDFSNSINLKEMLSNKTECNTYDNLNNKSSNVLFRYNERLEDNLSDSSKWGLVILENPIGELLLDLNQLDPNYYSIEENFKNGKRNKLYLISYNNANEKEEIETLSLDNRFVYLNSEKSYIIVPSNSKFLASDGFVYLDNLKLVGIYEGGVSKVLDCNKMKKMLDDVKFKNAQATLQHLLKIHLNNHKEPELRFLEINLLNKNDHLDLKKSLEHLKGIFFNDIGSLTFNSNYFNTFKEYFNSYDKLLSLFVAGPLLINKLSQKFQINSKNFDKYLLIKKLVNNENNDRYNIDNLEVIGYNINTYQFKILLHSFLYSKNLIHIDFSDNCIDLDKANLLSNFIYYSKTIKRLILNRTGMGYIELFFLIQGIKHSNGSLNLLNIGDNNFSKNHIKNSNYNNDKYIEELLSYFNCSFPSNLKFLSCLSEIKSIRELFMHKVHFKDQEEIKELFSHMNTIRELLIHKEHLKNQEENKNFDSNMNVIGEKENVGIEKQIMDCNENEMRYNFFKINGIRILSLSNNVIRRDAMEAIGNYIFNEQSLEEIYLEKCSIDDNSLIILCDYLSRKIKFAGSFENTPLKALDLSGNKITWKGAEGLREFLLLLPGNDNKGKNEENEKTYNKYPNFAESTKMSVEFTLILNNNTKFSEGVAKVCEGISASSPLLNLYFNNVGLTSIDLDAVFNVIISGYPIKILSLAGNNLEDYHIENNKFYKAFISPKCFLQELDLHFNKITISGIYSIVCNMKKKKKMKIICDPFEYKNLSLYKDSISNTKSKDIILTTNRRISEVDDLRNYEVCFEYVEFFNKKKKK